MRTHRLGSQGPELSVVGFGAWEAGGLDYGPNPPEDEVIRAIRAALDAGMSWIDTAEVYGDGTSEELVGRAIRGRRDDVFVASKVAPRPTGTGFRADQVRRACQDSLGRLGIEAIDLFQLHWVDRTGVPVEETWEAMARLVDEGLVRHVGVSNFDRDLIERCERIRHVDSLQPQFSMLQRKHRELIRWCEERGTGVVAYGPLGYGLLTGGITAETTFHQQDFRRGSNMFRSPALDQALDLVDALRPTAGKLGVTLAQLALAWTLHQDGVTSAIAGSRNADHVRDNAAAGDLVLDATTLNEVEALLRSAPDVDD